MAQPQLYAHLLPRMKKLRAQGWTYRAIAQEVSLPLGTVHTYLNREMARERNRDSLARYIARGCIPLCDMKD